MEKKDTCLKNIVFIHPFLLSYHYPRMQALMNECQRVGISLHNIALAGSYNVYKWFFTEGQTSSSNVTLFPNQSFDSVPESKMWTSLRMVLEQSCPDVIFLYGYSLNIMRQAKRWADKHGVATVLISDSNEFDKKRYKIWEFIKSFFISNVDGAFVGGTSSSLYLQKLGFPKERMTLGYDVVDNEFFCQRAKNNRIMTTQVREKWNLPQDYFLFVGRLIKEKNLPRLLEAYRSYTKTQTHPWSLVICGDGPERQDLQVLAASMQLEQKILFYGHIKPPEIVDFYSCASCLVLPSVSETWGLVVNEAMACGLPILISNHCGCAADLAINNLNGWRFDPTDDKALVDLMIKMSTLSPSARAEMGLYSEEIIAQWGLDTFSRNALECARMAVDHRIGSGNS